MDSFIDGKVVGVIALLSGLAIVLTLLKALLNRGGGARFPYFSRRVLMTPAELKFYQVLRRVVPPDVAIFGKVRLSDLMDCEREEKRLGYFAKISQKHADFVLVSTDTTAILCAIELDDRSHQLRHRQRRDEFVDGAFDAAGIPLIRITCAKEYDAASIAAELRGRMLPRARKSA